MCEPQYSSFFEDVEAAFAESAGWHVQCVSVLLMSIVAQFLGPPICRPEGPIQFHPPLQADHLKHIGQTR